MDEGNINIYMRNSTIKVSIICNTYNHEQYIRKTIDGFISQKTNFRFEVLIHDDGSTDNTQSIIKEYTEKYHDIIKPIFQIENQMSKGRMITREFQYPRVKGEYIAFCEGDDCWIDNNKLQKQIDYLDSHPKCTLCFTNGRLVENGIDLGRVIPWNSHNAKHFREGDNDYYFVDMLNIDYVPTASLVVRSYIFTVFPKVSENSFTGDTFIRLYATDKGYAHCIDYDSCIYHRGVKDSITTSWKNNINRVITFNDRMKNMFLDLDKLTDGKYSKSLIKQTKIKDYENIMLKKEYSSLAEWRYVNVALSKGVKEFIKYCIKLIFSRFLEVKK